MVSEHPGSGRPGPEGQTPAAFLARRANGPAPAGFIGLTDDAVLKIATAAFNAAQLLPIGGRDRKAEWARFDGAMAELAGRGLRHVLAKLREHGEAAGSDPGVGAS
jgi:hypothetical protein